MRKKIYVFLRRSLFFLPFLVSFTLEAQPSAGLVSKNKIGLYELTDAGASYFAQLSLDCAGKVTPHHCDYPSSRKYYKMDQTVSPRDLWPSFYGCYDWHSSVHNHWCMVKLLKKFPHIPEAGQIIARLDTAFSPQNMEAELKFISQQEEGFYEFPYGQSWFLKVADELKRWDDPLAKKWLAQMQPLLELIEENHLLIWSKIRTVKMSGSHDSPAMGISFALDYARSFHRFQLEQQLLKDAKKFYFGMQNAPLDREPFGYDFMSGSLLIADLMRKVLPQKEYTVWLRKFAPEIFNDREVDKALNIKKLTDHEGMESHWDGFHLNRIWCMNGMLLSLPATALPSTVKRKWYRNMNAMWDYAQESIGKGNYDIDHWLSSFSVFALCGYVD